MADLKAVKNQKKTSLKHVAHSAMCPACGYHVAVHFYDGGSQPLATLAWPKTPKQAQAMEKLPLNFVRCVDCGHVYNKDFDYIKVPYSEKPNLMYNRGKLWQAHVQKTVQMLLERLPKNPLVIEIGAGNGHFIRALAEGNPEGRYIAFDPNGSLEKSKANLEFYPALFDPTVHMAEFKPDLIICRHVLEHLTNPLGFLQQMAFSAQWEELSTELFVEVPCIDRVFETGRTADFFYEHHSNFTSESLARMLAKAGTQLEILSCGYEDEVVYALSKLNQDNGHTVTSREALDFYNRAKEVDTRVKNRLAKMSTSGERIAVWGGTGKSAAFINRYGVDAIRFPIVIDSDYDKVETCVPGTGQVILAPEYLEENPVQTILITTQWRAQDIALEIRERGISCKNLLLEHQGKLIDFYADPHPYKTGETAEGELPGIKLSFNAKHFASWKNQR